MSGQLTVDGLRSGYGQLTVLDGVTLRVEPGEIVAVLGANGAGKTTLLRTISGLLTPTRGEISLDGQAIQGLPAERLIDLGMAHVPENRLVFGSLSVADNLHLGAYRCHDAQQTRLRREMVLELFPRLRDRLKQAAGTLSGGEQQMLAVGRALMSGPSTLLLDEPSVGIAPRLIQEIFVTLAELRSATGLSVLVVEQNVSAVLRIADRAYVLDRGRVVLDGSAEEIRSDDRVADVFLGG